MKYAPAPADPRPPFGSAGRPTHDRLEDQQAEVVEKLVQSGRYQNASEVLRDGLRLLERRELEETAKLEAIRGALDEAEAAVAGGDVFDYDSALLEDADEDEGATLGRNSRV